MARGSGRVVVVMVVIVADRAWILDLHSGGRGTWIRMLLALHAPEFFYCFLVSAQKCCAQILDIIYIVVI